MAEWLYEDGIGEARAILVEGGAILEAVIELPGPRAGAIVEARLSSVAGIATLANGAEGIVSPLPAGITEGGTFRAEIVREAIPERGRPKPLRLRPSALPVRPGLSLAARIGGPAPLPAADPDRFEQAGWSELLEEAATGEIVFEGGALRMSLTPAMTLFDVDGTLAPEALAEAGAGAAARVMRRLGITGSVGIDLPTLRREQRQAAAAALDALLPQPFERTAVNGFGFLQVVRRRERPSIAELVQADPAGASARALLRKAERLAGPVTLHAAPTVIERLGDDWIGQLRRRTGGAVTLRPEPGLAISAGHAQGRA